jgi:hypothetical protein
MGQPGITSWVDFEATKKQLIAYLALDKSKNCVRHIGNVSQVCRKTNRIEKRGGLKKPWRKGQPRGHSVFLSHVPGTLKHRMASSLALLS